MNPIPIYGCPRLPVAPGLSRRKTLSPLQLYRRYTSVLLLLYSCSGRACFPDFFVVPAVQDLLTRSVLVPRTNPRMTFFSFLNIGEVCHTRWGCQPTWSNRRRCRRASRVAWSARNLSDSCMIAARCTLRLSSQTCSQWVKCSVACVPNSLRDELSQKLRAFFLCSFAALFYQYITLCGIPTVFFSVVTRNRWFLTLFEIMGVH